MRNDYRYICNECGISYTKEFIESNLVYLCPECGSCQKNQPLRGVLSIEYNYEDIKDKFTKESFLHFSPGKLWMYPELCPLDFERIDGNLLSRVTLPGNQLLKYKQDGRELLFFDETHNPTNSYKDRASILVALKAKELGITEIAAASTGNAGSSLAGICARLGIKAHIFVPKNIPEAKRIQIQAFGANIYLVDGDYDQAYDLSLKISNDKGWYNRNTAYNPLTIEGKKSAAFDMYIQTKGDLPDKIFVPVGDGVIISGLYKGFLELMKLGLIDKLPQLIAVQAEGSSAVIDYLTTGEFIYKPAHTIADSISAGAPRNLYVASKAVKETKGFGIKVNDEELLKAQKELSYKFGLLTEPSSASVYAAYNSVAEKLSDSERVMLLITGSGLKDFESLKLWNEKPAVRTSGEWKEYLTGTKSNI